MAPAVKSSQFSDAALQRRLALVGKTGPAALMRNIRVFGIASFACIGGLLYGYNQGVFSGVLYVPIRTFDASVGILLWPVPDLIAEQDNDLVQQPHG